MSDHTQLPAEQAWRAHKRGCWRCQRQAARWEDGEMTCEPGVQLLIAWHREQEAQPALFEVTP